MLLNNALTPLPPSPVEPIRPLTPAIVEIANEHAGAPAKDSIPAAHVKHPSLLDAPSVGLYVPMGQLTQYVAPEADEAYVPAGQMIQPNEPATLE